MQLGHPALEARSGLGLERPEASRPLLRVGIVPAVELRCELQQPGKAVGPLERRPAGTLEIGQFAGDVQRCQALRDRCPRLGTKGRVRKHMQQAHQEPVPVDVRMPVVATVERGIEFMRRTRIRIAVQGVGDVARVLRMQALERESGEARGGGRIHRTLSRPAARARRRPGRRRADCGTRREVQRQDHGRDGECPAHRTDVVLAGLEFIHASASPTARASFAVISSSSASLAL